MFYTALTLAEAAAILEADADLVQCALDNGKLPSLQLDDVRKFRDAQAESFDDLFVEFNSWELDLGIESCTVH
ncbi:hypothetical protein HFO61_30290 [Rhizobium leguminosarum]|uniref:hypothetical protein n=1 Tax=Rhizobium leguminosarum TaxID=384 RepID=UPI001C974F81|nr:hypothetical protein [Rhizobium leguminosarum]MBY5551037.1 hypothetical protein [Rhizobium leguminosarum]